MPITTDRVYGHDPPQRVNAPPQRVFPLNNVIPISQKIGAPPNRAMFLFTLQLKSVLPHRLSL